MNHSETIPYKLSSISIAVKVSGRSGGPGLSLDVDAPVEGVTKTTDDKNKKTRKPLCLRALIVHTMVAVEGFEPPTRGS